MFAQEKHTIVTIVRDQYGVPHIYSDTAAGLFYGFGYATAEDRLFQLDINRRTVQGRVSELLGSKYLAFDNITRRDTYTKEELAKMIALLDEEHQSMLRAYAMGINSYIREALSDPVTKMPGEYLRLGVIPEPNWSAEDVLSIMLGFIGQSFMDRFFYGVELSNAALYKWLIDRYGDEVGKGMFNDLVWLDDPTSPTTISSSSHLTSYTSSTQEKSFSVSDSIKHVLNVGKAERDEAESVFRSLGLPSSMGSNMWVAGKDKSATGEAMLHGGPQFWWHFPGFLHEVGLHGAGFDAVGAQPVGFPLIMFGHNGYIAWSNTYGVGDLVDVYIEKLNPANPCQYWFNGKWVDMEVRVDILQAKDSSPVKVTYYRTVHGPVFAVDLKEGVAYSRRRAFWGVDVFDWSAWLEVSRAKSVQDAIKTLRNSSYSVNWFFADREGNIGYVHTGRDPIRARGIDPRFPTPGTGEYEWVGFTPFEEWPKVVNPEKGYLVQWNERPSKDYRNNERQSGWGTAHRVEILDDYLKVRPKVTADDLIALNRFASFQDPMIKHLKPYISSAVRSLRPNDSRLIEAVSLLEAWDGQRVDTNGDGLYDHPGQTIFEAWLPIMLEKTFKDEFGDYFSMLQYNYPEAVGGPTTVPLGVNVLIHALEGPRAGVPPSRDYFNGVDPKVVIVESLERALLQLQTKYGTQDMMKWKRSINILRFGTANVFGVPQSFVSPKDVIFMNRGTQNHFVVLGKDRIQGWNVVPPGQSGFTDLMGKTGAHYSDQIDLYVGFTYKRMLFTKQEVEEAAESKKLLIYPPKASLDDVLMKTSELDAKLLSLSKDLQTLLTKLAEAEKSIASLNVDFKGISSALGDVRGRISTFEKEISTLKEGLEGLKSSIPNFAAKAELDKLINRVASLEDEASKLRNQIRDISVTIGDMAAKADLQKVSDKITQMTDDLRKIESSISELRKTSDRLANDLSALLSSHNYLTSTTLTWFTAAVVIAAVGVVLGLAAILRTRRGTVPK
ncbi:MAG: penicillin acylase family protein [Nitrososphaerales archaeon]